MEYNLLAQLKCHLKNSNMQVQIVDAPPNLTKKELKCDNCLVKKIVERNFRVHYSHTRIFGEVKNMWGICVIVGSHFIEVVCYIICHRIVTCIFIILL